MSFALPLTGTFARECCGDLETLAEQLNPANVGKLPDFREAVCKARKNFPAGAKAVMMVCLRGDDERWLISVGPRGGWRKIWNFGRGR